jgi:phosphoenolpyruvate-protein kinase (PTS system EI component)
MMARKYHIPVLISSEMSRTHYQPKKEKVTIDCFKESVSLEYEAAWIGILSENDKQKTMHCLKANQGTGRRCDLNYKLNITNMVICEEMRCEEMSHIKFDYSSF